MTEASLMPILIYTCPETKLCTRSLRDKVSVREVSQTQPLKRWEDCHKTLLRETQKQNIVMQRGLREMIQTDIGGRRSHSKKRSRNVQPKR